MSIEVGGGLLTIVSNGLLFGDVDPIGFKIEGTPDIKKAYAMKGGKKVLAGSVSFGSEFELVLTIEAMTWQAMQVASGQASATALLYSRPLRKSVKVPKTAPFTITDPLIVDNTVYASLTRNGDTTLGEAWGVAQPLTRVTTVPLTAREFQVTFATNLLTFPAILAGADVDYVVNEIIPTVESIGVSPNPVSLETIAFHGVTYGDKKTGRHFINIKEATLASITSYDYSDIVKAEMRYSIVSQGNNPIPYEKIRLPGF
jgi:hypothetical protein